jgi:hypothetical protein
MEQKKTRTTLCLQKKKAVNKSLQLLKPLIYLGIMLFSVSFTACEKSPMDPKSVNIFPAISNKVILDWNTTALNAMEAPNYQHVLVASRLYAMVHIAQYDALNSIKPVYKKYCNTTEDATAHPVAAAAFAAYTVLLHNLPGKKVMLDSQLAKAIDTIVDINAKQKGIALGLQCGNAIIDQRKDDGAFQDPVGTYCTINSSWCLPGGASIQFCICAFLENDETFWVAATSAISFGAVPGFTKCSI